MGLVFFGFRLSKAGVCGFGWLCSIGIGIVVCVFVVFGAIGECGETSFPCMRPPEYESSQ